MKFANRFPVLFSLAVAIAGVSAQSFDQCGETCISTTVAKGYCSSINDTSCVCSNTQFQTTLASCLTSCSSSDLAAAEQLQNQTCSKVSNSTSSAQASGTNSVASSASPASPSSSSTKSNGATTVEQQLPLLSTIIVIAGALMGGALVL